MLFRFIEYNYSNYKEDKYKNPNFICGIKVESDYECMNRLLNDAIGHDINLADDWYTIKEITYGYGGTGDDAFCVNIWCCAL